MNHYRVKPGQAVDLHDHDAHDTGDYENKEEATERTEHLRQKLDALQELLYAEGNRAVLIVLQGIDTAGKDGTIRHVMSGVNPQGCRVTSFKAPTPLEVTHDFLWRIHAACPPHGYIGIFNRSHYEDVLITKVHDSITEKETGRRLGEIRDFEKMLTNSGTRVLKFFLHISEKEQKQRLLERLDNADKHWKFSLQDLKERGYYQSYQKAFDDALSATSTEESPWFVVPANHKWYRNLVVAENLVHALKDMDPQLPKIHDMDWKKLRHDVEET